MDNKKTTVILVVLLVILIALMFFRACGVGPWVKKNIEPAAEPEIVAVEPEEAVIEEVIIETPPVLEEVEVKLVSEPQPEQKPVAKPKPASKPKAVPKTETSKSDLPKPAVQKPKREKVAAPVFTNKSGFKPFYVYTDIGSKGNHYSPYGLMGDISALNMGQGSKTQPHSGTTCIRVTYTPTKGKLGWAGVYWTEPANNWGDKGFGFNLTGAERVSFWARGEKGGEVVNNFIIGGIQGKQHEDSDSRAIGPIELTTEWKQFFIDLNGADLSNIIGGFCFTVTESNNTAGAVFYLDDIVYE